MFAYQVASVVRHHCYSKPEQQCEFSQHSHNVRILSYLTQARRYCNRRIPCPKDDVTQLKALGSIFGAVLDIVPFTGTVAKGAGAAGSELSFVLTRVQPPKSVDKFLAWPNVASSVGDVFRDYENILLNSINKI
ncbi:hypothetical protein GQ44DRAFT_763510 [Phaeosphaeriaceae sp. PMI808]|nr:hypothetical protein GQ44DRAFT_763510 [Phaeosphaeriaceae sp. PMI808]